MEESREKHSFKKGIAAGIVLTSMAFALTGCTAAYFLPNFAGRGNTKEREQIDAKCGRSGKICYRKGRL